MINLDEIREILSIKFLFKNKNEFSVITVNDYGIIKEFLIAYKDKIPKNEWAKIHGLMMNFSLNSNILALQLIYNKYVKNDNP